MSTSKSGMNSLRVESVTALRENFPQTIEKTSPRIYGPILLFHDLVVFLSALLGAVYFSFRYLAGAFWPDYGAAVLSLFLMTIVFFKAFRLYDGHFIFEKRLHLVGLLKAFTLGLCTLVTVVFTLVILNVIGSRAWIVFIVCFSVGILLVSRFYYERALKLLQAMGMALALIGAASMLEDISAFALPETLAAIFISYTAAAGVVLATRLFLVHRVLNTWLGQNFRRQVLIVGSDSDASGIADHVIKHNAPFWIAGNVGDCDLALHQPKMCLGVLADLPDLIKVHRIQEVVITDPDIAKLTLVDILDLCTSAGVTAWFLPKLMPVINLKVKHDTFCGIELIRLCAQSNVWLTNKAKHFVDAVISLPLVILLLPVFGLFAAAIKINSAGPVFYRAQAVGKHARRYTMYKFRTMYVNTDDCIHKEYVTNLITGKIDSEGKTEGPRKITDDPRVTRVGKFLRKTSLDELPQLLNVLKADMSLVGPRPCLPYEYELYQDWHKKRTAVRPGITGLWQVTGRSEVAFDDMILLDLFYIYNRSLLLDFQIMYETVFAVLAKKGAY